MGFIGKIVKKTQNSVENRMTSDLSRSIVSGVGQAIHNAGTSLGNAAQTLGSWKCAFCDTENRADSKFCTGCGREKGAKKIFFKCDKCGYEHTDPKTSPRFCPKCGVIVNEADKIQS